MARTMCILCVSIIAAVMVEAVPVLTPDWMKNWSQVSGSLLQLMVNERSSIQLMALLRKVCEVPLRLERLPSIMQETQVLLCSLTKSILTTCSYSINPALLAFYYGMLMSTKSRTLSSFTGRIHLLAVRRGDL